MREGTKVCMQGTEKTLLKFASLQFEGGRKEQ